MNPAKSFSPQEGPIHTYQESAQLNYHHNDLQAVTLKQTIACFSSKQLHSIPSCIARHAISAATSASRQIASSLYRDRYRSDRIKGYICSACSRTFYVETALIQCTAIMLQADWLPYESLSDAKCMNKLCHQPLEVSGGVSSVTLANLVRKVDNRSQLTRFWLTYVCLALDESEIAFADEAVLAGGFGRADLGGSVAGNLWHKGAVLIGDVVCLLCGVVRQTVDFTGWSWKCGHVCISITALLWRVVLCFDIKVWILNVVLFVWNVLLLCCLCKWRGLSVLPPVAGVLSVTSAVEPNCDIVEGVGCKRRLLQMADVGLRQCHEADQKGHKVHVHLSTEKEASVFM